MQLKKMVSGGLFLMICLSLAQQSFGSSFEKVAFILMTQNHHSLHVKISNETKENLKQNLVLHKVDKPKVYDLIHDWPIHGGWSLFKLFPRIKKLLSSTKWFVFLPENAIVDLKELEQVFSKFPQDTGIFLGKGLNNEDIQYIDVHTGYAMSTVLLANLMKDHPDISVYRIVTKLVRISFSLNVLLVDNYQPAENFLLRVIISPRYSSTTDIHYKMRRSFAPLRKSDVQSIQELLRRLIKMIMYK
jgi:hypothetical protein